MQSLLKPLVVLVGLVATGSAIAECTGNVTIGEGGTQITTKVPTKAIGNACLNDLIIDTTAEANYGSQIEFDVALAKLVGDWTKNRTISALQAVELLIAGARSDVGKTIKLRIIGINDFHGNLLSPGNFGGKPSGGADYLPDMSRRKSSGTRTTWWWRPGT
jgi:5'-nucleotidase